MDGEDDPDVSVDTEENMIIYSSCGGAANIYSLIKDDKSAAQNIEDINRLSSAKENYSSQETRLDFNFINQNSDSENEAASSHERNDVFTARVDSAARCSYESSRPVDVFNTKRNRSSPVEQHCSDSHMFTESETQSDCREGLLKIQVPSDKPNNGNSINPNRSDKNQRVNSSLDHVESVSGRSKVLSPCQSLAARVFSWRSMMLLLLHLSFVINIIPKNTAPIAIVCMVSPTSGKEPGLKAINATTHGDFIDQQNGGVNSEHLWNSTTEKIDEFEFDWDSNTVGLVLSAIAFTSWFGPFFASMICGYLGNKWTLTLLTLGSALTTLLSPLAARIGPSFLVGLRVISGLAVGGNLPIVADTLVWWTPESERLTTTTIAYSGFNVAGIITFFIAGFLCSVPLDNGWPFIFYIFGAVTLLWILAWHILCSQKPEDHPWISGEEKSLIISKRSVSVGSKEAGRKDKPPYCVIMTSLPIIVHFLFTSVHIWSITIIYTYIPVYFSRRLGLTPEQTGVLVSCVGFFRLIGAFVWTAIGNMLMIRPGMTTNKNRKISFTTGSTVSGILFVALAFIDSDLRWLAASILFALMITHSVYAVLTPIVVMDMAPRYTGFISGITMSIASVVAIPGPLMVAALTPTNAHSEWMAVWLIMAGVMLVTPVIFLVFGQASPLPWATAHVPTCPPEKTTNEPLMGGPPSLST